MPTSVKCALWMYAASFMLWVASDVLKYMDGKFTIPVMVGVGICYMALICFPILISRGQGGWRHGFLFLFVLEVYINMAESTELFNIYTAIELAYIATMGLTLGWLYSGSARAWYKTD